jgi:hypothetical protein
MLHPVTVGMATIFLAGTYGRSLMASTQKHSSTSQSVYHTSLKSKTCSCRNTAACWFAYYVPAGTLGTCFAHDSLMCTALLH